MAVAKVDFLKTSFVALLQTIPTDAAPLWGKMTLQQMVEHFTDAVRIAAGLVPDAAIVSPEEHLPKLQAFIRSDKPFKENTRNPLLPETPAPVRARSIEAALHSLQEAIDAFF